MEQKTLLKNKKNQGNGGETTAKRDDSVKKKVPELRFKGFTDDWEQRKLGDIAPLRGGFAFKSSKFRNTGVPIVRISNILSSGEVGGDFAYYDEQDEDDKYILPDKSAVLAMSGATTGKVSILSQTDYDKVYQNQRVGYFQSVENIDYGFISTIVRSELFVMQLDSVLVSGAQPNVSSKEIDSFNFMVPSYEEQQKIGTFFKQLDCAIALHQRKLDLLKEQKKGYLQKMFPKNGEKVPELRFAGFADDWEERKLGELSQDTFGGGTPKTSVTEYWNGEIPWIQSSDLSSDHLFGVLPKKHITENAVKNSATKLIPKNSIAIVTRVGVGKLAFMPYEFTSSQDFLSLSNLQVDCNFGVYSIYKILQRELNNIQGTSIKGITKADLLDKEVIIPVEFEEQKKIGSFFKRLDDTIALHQRKLDLLKEQKKGFLQKMFV